MDVLFEKIMQTIGENVDRLMTAWPYKLLLGGVLVVMEKHVAIFTAFALIVCIDLFAKLMALSYKSLTAGKNGNITVIDTIRGIPEAHRNGTINSYAMRTKFAEKIGVYLMLVTAAALVDFAIGKSEFASLVIAYQTASELLSIVENLDEAGINAVHDLAAIIKRHRVD